jgi:hypothetical protein
MTSIDATEVAQIWESWAAAGHYQSRTLARQGKLFESTLKQARATTYAHAIALLRANHDAVTVARLMIKQAAEIHVRTPPLIGFDDAALRYTVARAWQRCALMLDPSLVEVQPLWSDH